MTRKICVQWDKGRGANNGCGLLCLDMAVIPLTLTISLGLALTFVARFLREHERGRRGGPERDSLLPLSEETRNVIISDITDSSKTSSRS